MAASPGHTYENDILGNRSWRSPYVSTVRKYVWDDVNRMESYASESIGAAYKYRADGMRIQKVEGLTLEWSYVEEEKSGYYDENWAVNKPTTRTMHDGQMTVEEDFTRTIDDSMVVDIYKYGIGARGIDWIEKDTYNASPVVAFPIYDGHGNMVATAGRVGSGFQNADPRAYDAWGGVRGGNTTGDPKQRYCANLGHVQDDESDLIYMRARYYEPWTGRFVSQDPENSGNNWYAYCRNRPTWFNDPSGCQESLASLIEGSTEAEALNAAVGSGVARIVAGKVTELALYVQLRYQLTFAVLTGFGTSMRGEFMWRFTTSYGNYLVRFNLVENAIKYNASGPKLNNKNIKDLNKFMSDFQTWLQDGMPWP
jgi:RHS repeat-associated protein